MKVALVQQPIAWEDKQANFDLVRDMLADIDYSDNDGGLIVLPELFATGFTMNAESIAEDEGGQTDQFLMELAAEKSAHIVAGVAYKNPGENPVNCATIVSPEREILCRYQKTHPFSLGEEDQNYSRGETVHTVSIKGINISPTVCYDLRFPELFRLAAENDTQLYIVIANWPSKRTHHWVSLLKARAIENQAYIIGVNRCGEDPNLEYDGSTMLIDYLGESVVDAGTQPGVVEAELNLSGLQEWRDGFPALRDRHGGLVNPS